MRSTNCLASLAILCLIALSSCAPKVITSVTRSHPPLAQNDDVRVFGITEPLSAPAEHLGTVRIEDSGFSTKCGWNFVLEKARAEARKVGGNAIKITEHVPPAFQSTCHQIKASILRMEPADPPTDDIGYVPYVIDRPSAPPAPEQPFPRLRLSGFGGGSYRLAKLPHNVPPVVKDYLNGLRSGFNYGGDITYYFSEQIGIGLKHNAFRAENSLENVVVELPDGTFATGTLSESINIAFTGPMVASRILEANQENSLVLQFGIGYMSYRDDLDLISKYTLTGGVLGMCWELGYDIGIAKDLALGFQLSYMMGTLTQIEISDGTHKQTVKLEPGEFENLSRIDLTIGLRFIR